MRGTISSGGTFWSLVSPGTVGGSAGRACGFLTESPESSVKAGSPSVPEVPRTGFSLDGRRLRKLESFGFSSFEGISGKYIGGLRRTPSEDVSAYLRKASA